MDPSLTGQEDEEIDYGSMDWISPQAFCLDKEVREIQNCARDFIYNSYLDSNSKSKEKESTSSSMQKINPSPTQNLTFGSNALLKEVLDMKRIGIVEKIYNIKMTADASDLMGTDLGNRSTSAGSTINGFNVMRTPNHNINHTVNSPLSCHSSQQILWEAGYVEEILEKGGELRKKAKTCTVRRYSNSKNSCSCKPYGDCKENSESNPVRPNKEFDKQRRRAKTLKAREGKTRMVLGLDVTMDMVLQLSSCGLVGKFIFHNQVSKEAMN